MMKKAHIERMLRFSGYMVVLSCGHSYECSVADVERHRLFIGKAVPCRECSDRESEAEEREA